MSPSTHSADVSQIQTDTTAILVDTGTTIPATIATVDGNVDSILVDTGTTIPATIATVDGNVDSILVDTGTTIPATLSAELPDKIFMGENVSTAVSATSTTPVTGLNITADLPAGDYQVEACVSGQGQTIGDIIEIALDVGGTRVSYWRHTPSVSSDVHDIVLRGGGCSDGDNVNLKVYCYAGTGPCVMQKQTIYAIKLRS